MSIVVNGTTVTKVVVNGVEVNTVICNGTTVFTSKVDLTVTVPAGGSYTWTNNTGQSVNVKYTISNVSSGSEYKSCYIYGYLDGTRFYKAWGYGGSLTMNGETVSNEGTITVPAGSVVKWEAQGNVTYSVSMTSS